MAYWKKEEIDFLKENYNKMKISDLSRLLKRSRSSISWQAQKQNLVSDNSKYKKYTFDEHFFSKITPISCYIAGLIASDGCVRTKKGCFSFYQKTNDLIVYIKKVLNSNYPIYYRKRKNTEEYSIQMSSKVTISDLSNNFKIVDNKSFLGLDVPEKIIDIDCIRCYIAGLLDGDGSISLKKRTKNGKDKISFTLLCSKKILDWINFSLKLNMSIQKRKDSNTDLYSMYGSHNKAMLFLEPIFNCLKKNDIQITSKWEKVNANLLLCSN